MSPFAQALLATFLVSALSLIGIVIALRDWTSRIEIAAISFGAGVLLATTFLELLPEAVEHAGTPDVLWIALAAFAAFFALERLIHGLHGDHSEDLGHDHDHVHDSHHLASRYLILVGDSVHNFIDGVVIAASFVADPSLGVTTALAVAAHEIPHEIADYSILVASKLDRLTALALNFATALTALLGVLVCFAFRGFVESHVHWFMAATAGMFLYIAAAGLIPQIHHSPYRRSWLCTGPFFLGIGLMVVIAAVVPHPR
jgi:zinc and cadmium transporter